MPRALRVKPYVTYPLPRLVFVVRVWAALSHGLDAWHSELEVLRLLPPAIAVPVAGAGGF